MRAFRSRCHAFVGHYGLDRVLLVDITLKEQMSSPDEANRIWHSIAENLVNARAVAWFRVMGTSEKGALHFHVLIALQHKIAGNLFQVLETEREFWAEASRTYPVGRVAVNRIRCLPKLASYLLGNLNRSLSVFPGGTKRFATASKAARELFRDQQRMSRILEQMERSGMLQVRWKKRLPAIITLA